MMKPFYLLLLFCLLTATVAKSQQTESQRRELSEKFMKDMYGLNLRHKLQGNASFVYEYAIYNDSSASEAVQSFPFSVTMYNKRSWYRYLDTELLNDTGFTVMIDHRKKKVSLMKKQETSLPVSMDNMIDTATFTRVLEQVTRISYVKKGRTGTYTLIFGQAAELSSMRISYEDNGLLTALVTNRHAAGNEGTPRCMKITRTAYTALKSQPAVLETRNYFELFGNGKYVLKAPYQNYQLNNLYEKPVY